VEDISVESFDIGEELFITDFLRNRKEEVQCLLEVESIFLKDPLGVDKILEDKLVIVDPLERQFEMVANPFLIPETQGQLLKLWLLKSGH